MESDTESEIADHLIKSSVYKDYVADALKAVKMKFSNLVFIYYLLF